MHDEAITQEKNTVVRLWKVVYFTCCLLENYVVFQAAGLRSRLQESAKVPVYWEHLFDAGSLALICRPSLRSVKPWTLETA